MSSKKRKSDKPDPRLDKAAETEAQNRVADIERLLTKHAKRVPDAAQEKLRAAIDQTKDALEAQQAKRLSAALKDLEAAADKHLGFARKSTLHEYAESIGVAVLIAVLLRFFVLEAFKIPTGSMIPTLAIGDHIFVNKFIYGLRVPLSNESWFARWGSPSRGDVIVFRFPKDKSKDYIKRVIAIAGDKVRVEGHDVFVNDQKLPHAGGDPFRDDNDPFSTYINFTERSHVEDGEYSIQYKTNSHSGDFPNWNRNMRLKGLDCRKVEQGKAECTVEPEFLFVMGDNRDNSEDSRWWGGVPYSLVKGRAMFVWFSWGPQGIDWSRIGKVVR